ncbi:EAL domain-containing protein [Tardiphaga sp.]|uniref:EAL domain-containing protein n=1 Tax=Tardiphaga sp. TaxID=1926292 RepID=UPI00261442A9|nr:EAL domain-containing protein [Tardiphaga sp.]MDB5618801.1 diguanylate phosphodiesterase [Tardiphaga sp.]
MIRISTIFIAICMVLVSASLGMVLYAMAGISGQEAAIVALAVLTFLILYNAVSMRLRERSEAGGQIADLSRGTVDLARQVSEFGRRLNVLETKVSAAHPGPDRIQSVIGEIGELGALVTQLAATVATHEDLIAAGPAPAAVPMAAAIAPPVPPQVRPDAIAPEILPAADIAEDTVTAMSRPVAVSPPAVLRNDAQMLATVTGAINANRIDIYLQPMVTLPQRKVRFYEAMTRLRDDKEQVIVADDFIAAAEAAGLMGQIDHTVMLRCMQVLRRLMVRNKDVGVFCNVAGSTLSSTETFAQCIDFLDANRALASSFVLEFRQDTFRNLGPIESEHLAALAQRGYRFSIDHVTDLRIVPRELADRGVRFIKVPARLLLDPQQNAGSDIHPADLSDLLGRFGIDLIAERIEGERAVIDLLDFDVRFGQGFLFAAPRPLRPEAPAAATAPLPSAQAPSTPNPGFNGAARPRSEAPKIDPPRVSGTAALARRASGTN